MGTSKRRYKRWEKTDSGGGQGSGGEPEAGKRAVQGNRLRDGLTQCGDNAFVQSRGRSGARRAKSDASGERFNAAQRVLFQFERAKSILW